MMLLNYLILFLYFYKVEGHAEQVENEVQTLEPEHQSRRILKGEAVTDTRPYMVYLRPAPPPTKKPGEPRTPAVTAHAQTDANWLCGGVIIHPYYVLTSAACIEDVTHFYIVSGTHTWVPPKDTNDCIKHGATRAVWKCVPKTYTFDGYAFNNIRWMENDIAVVMTAEPFNFKQRVKGCDFVPQMIRYNNESKSLEAAGTQGSIAGWGSTEEYVDPADIIARVNVNSPQLLEADVKVVSKKSCKRQWWPQYHEIIDEHMICGKPVNFEDEVACTNGVDCRELYRSEEKDDEEIRRTRHHHPSLASLHRSLARVKSRRRAKQRSLRREGKEVGGFCENDHGGPLITGHGKSAVVIGVMSAFRTMNFSNRCAGPYLYTSVFNNRNLIDCAIQKHSVARCRTILRSGGMILDQEIIDWGPGRLRSQNNEKRERRKRKKEKKDKLRRSRNGTRNGVLAMSPVKLVSDAAVIEIEKTIPPDVKDILKNANVSEVHRFLNKSRRIINGVESVDNRPYMVYLQLPTRNPKYRDYRRWLCGGVIIHENYILTSAACIEDAKNFYVVSGTYRHSLDWSGSNNLCIKNGAKKAVWKCVPKNYVFDGHENDNIRWMNNDIAVVKVEDEFDFERRVRGCDFVPKPIDYNNQSSVFEQPGKQGIIAGWGSILRYDEWVSNNRKQGDETNVLKETNVQIISKRNCKHRWGSRYANIIDNYMICTKDLIADLSEVCEEKYVDCTDVMYSDEDEESRRRAITAGTHLNASFPHQNASGRRESYSSGGFCENDHGGPLIASDGRNPVVIGIISACLVKERTNKCYGPFLYTSVYKNRVLLNCAIYRTHSTECSKQYRSSITHTETVMSWSDHPDGPAKTEIAAAALRRTQEKKTEINTTNVTNETNDEVTSAKETNHEVDGAKKTSDEVNGAKETSMATAGAHLDKDVLPTTGPQATQGASTNVNFVDRIIQHNGIVLRSS